jgi:fucose permease
VISPVIIGLLSDHYGDMNKAFVVVGVMCLLSGILWLWGSLYLERDTRLAPSRLGAPAKEVVEA